MLRQLGHRPAAAAPIRTLARELPYAKGVALKKARKKKIARRKLWYQSVPNFIGNRKTGLPCGNLPLSQLVNTHGRKQRAGHLPSLRVPHPSWDSALSAPFPLKLEPKPVDRPVCRTASQQHPDGSGLPA